MVGTKYYIINFTDPPIKADDSEDRLIDIRPTYDRSLPPMASFLYSKLAYAIDLKTNELRVTGKELAVIAEAFQLEAIRFLKLLKKAGYIQVTEIKE